MVRPVSSNSSSLNETISVSFKSGTYDVVIIGQSLRNLSWSISWRLMSSASVHLSQVLRKLLRRKAESLNP